jgi:hypothetical protein
MVSNCGSVGRGKSLETVVSQNARGKDEEQDILLVMPKGTTGATNSLYKFPHIPSKRINLRALSSSAGRNV